jgi:hypothetical protein
MTILGQELRGLQTLGGEDESPAAESSQSPNNQENGMSGLSANLEKGEYREVLFWLLLLGSWQFLASSGGKNGIVGALGTAAFLVFAWTNMDRLRGLGLDHAGWWSPHVPIGCTQR